MINNLKMSVSVNPKSELFAHTSYEKVTQSSAQQKYTFSKAQRFPKIKATTDLVGYNLPSTKTEKSAAFGFGDRSTFRNKRGK